MDSQEPFGIEVVDDDWPHGLRCAECERELREGDRYSEKFEGLSEYDGEAVPIVVIVCVGCALGS